MCALPTVDRHCLTFGYLRGFIKQHHIKQSYVVPTEIYELIYQFYGESYIIYGVGRNFCGQFGAGHILKVRQYAELSRFSALCDSPRYIFLRSKTFYIQTQSNQIYFAGFDDITNEFATEFEELRTPLIQNPKVLLISEGLHANHTFFIIQNQTHNRTIKLLALGNNYRGQFGNGGRTRKYENIYIHDVTERITAFVGHGAMTDIKQIKCGENHTLFLTQHGLMYACGCNRYSQCGHESVNNDLYYYPKSISIKNVSITDICCGSNHNLCLSSDRRLYVFGSNVYGQIGRKWNTNSMEDTDGDQIIQPKLHKYFAEVEIKTIACGSDYSMVMDYDGNCWLFGDNRCGQIGVSRERESVDQPFRIQTHKELQDMSCEYGSCGYTHTVLCSTKQPQQNIYVFGCNLHNECSSVRKEIRFMDVPYLLTKQELFGDKQQYKIKRVIAARCSTLIICRK